VGQPAFFVIVTKQESISPFIESTVQRCGARLVDFSVRKHRNLSLVEVFVDTETGISAEVLVEISRAVDALIQEHRWFGEAYNLMVSSPGLDRPVRFPWQYRRHLGKSVEVQFALEGQTNSVTGIISDVDDERLLLSLETGVREIPYESIQQARILASLK